MRWIVHAFGGLVAFGLGLACLCFKIILWPSDLVMFFFGCIYLSQLPDADHKMSKITWFNLTIALLIMFISYFFSSLSWFIVGFTIAFLNIIFINLRHRGVLHSIPFIFVVSFVMWYFAEIHIFFLPFLFLAGWSHLLFDGLPFKFSFKKVI